MKIKNVLHPFSQLFSQKQLIAWTKRKTIFPFYHTISDADLPYISNLYPLVNVNQFKADLDYICKDFEPLHLKEIDARKGRSIKQLNPGFHLTFDDGLREIYDVIAPILEERNIPATFFVNTDFIDNKQLFYRYKIGVILEYLKGQVSANRRNALKTLLKEKSKWKTGIQDSLLQLIYLDQPIIDEIADVLEIDFDAWLSENKPYLSSDQIKDLIRRGFTIGSHSIDHPRFKYFDVSFQKAQVEKSFSFLKESFGIENRYFSFPFGDEEVSKALFDWMYSDMKIKKSFGVSGLKDDYSPDHIHRIPMDECNNNPKRFIKSEYLYFMVKSIFNKNQIVRH